MPVIATIPIPADFLETAASYPFLTELTQHPTDGYLYGCYRPGALFGGMVKVKADNFTDITTVTFASDGQHIDPVDMVYVPSTDRFYVLFRNSDANRCVISAVTPSTLARTDFFNFEDIQVGAGSITADATNLYVVTFPTDPSYLVIIPIAAPGTFAEPTPLTGFSQAHCVRQFGGKLFVQGMTPPTTGWVMRLTTAGVVEETATFTGEEGEFPVDEIGESASHIWVGNRDLSGEIRKYSKTSFANPEVILTTQLSKCTCVKTVGGFVWAAFENGRGVRINPSNIADRRTYTLNEGQGYHSEFTGGNEFVYTYNYFAGKIARYHIPSDAVPSPSLVGFLPGLQTARDVKVVGTVAYVACDKFGLSTVDISTPASPAILGSANIPFDGRHVVVSGSHAYVTGPRTVHAIVSGSGQVSTVNGFWVINISDTSAPTVVGRIESASISFEGFAISGTHAFVASQSGGIRVIDISNPENPSIATTFPISGFAGTVEIAGSLAYVTMGTSGLRILNISTPTSPSLVGTIDTPGTAVAVSVSGNFAYVADTARLQVIDVSNPASPALRGTITRTVTDVIVSGSLAYVSCGASGMMIANVSDPNSPTELSIRNPPSLNGAASGAFLVGTTLYFANQGGGLAVLDVNNTSNPTVTSVFNDIFQATGIALKSNYAILTGLHNTGAGLVQTSEILVVDVSDTGRPTVAARLTSAQASAISISGNYAYVPSGSLGLRVINLTNPLLPSIETTFALGGFAQGIGISGIHAYVGLGTFGVKIVNISNPSAPSLTGSVDTPGTAATVDVGGTSAYISDGSSLQVANVSNPSNPGLIGSLTRTNNNVKVQGATLYMSGNASGMFIIDVTTPSNPIQLSVLPATGLNGATAAIAIDGTRAYMANQATGLAIADVQNSSQPVLLASIPTVGVSKAIAVQGSLLFIADTLAGIDIIAI